MMYQGQVAAVAEAWIPLTQAGLGFRSRIAESVDAALERLLPVMLRGQRLKGDLIQLWLLLSA